MAKIIIDITERGRNGSKCVGWMTHDDRTIDLLGSTEKGKWYLYGGISDEYRGEAKQISRAAVQLFGHAFGVDPKTVSGVIEITDETDSRNDKRYGF